MDKRPTVTVQYTHGLDGQSPDRRMGDLRDRAATDLYSIVNSSDENIDTVVESNMAALDVEYFLLCEAYSTVLT